MRGLLLVCVRGVIRPSFKCKFSFYFPRVVGHVINIQIFVTVVPTHHIEVAIVAENVIAKGAYLGQSRIALHQVFVHVEAEAFLRARGLVKPTKQHYSFVVDRHAHR